MLLGKTPDEADVLRKMRGEPVQPKPLPSDHVWRDEILRKALTYLSEHNVPYVPVDIEEDIQASYEDDSLEDFRETVRGWIKALVTAGRGVA